MRRILFSLCLLLVFSLACHALAPVATAAALPVSRIAPPNCAAGGMALLDAESGTLLASQNADARLPMASTTKIMTALVVLERLPLDRVVTVPAEATGIEGSSVYLFAGEQITEEDVLYLERKAFMELAQNEKTVERIKGMLTTGKPVRN